MKEKIKEFKGKLDKPIEKFKSLSKGKKMAIISSVVAISSATILTFIYAQQNKYEILFSNLEVHDASSITAELENRKVDMKIKGNTIYVDKNEVDKLRLELAPTITDGSKGFELMDETSSIGLTDEEFQLKKQRMIQGEIEKTIKSFPQVESSRVHISPGEKSIFEKEDQPGRAAVYIILKEGTTLERNQVKSIISLVAGSTENIPKENIDVIDGNMNLLSEGVIDDEENSEVANNAVTLSESKDAEAQLNKKLELSILKMLEPIFGSGKVKATVSTDLNFDSIVTTDLTIKPDKVAIKETRLKSTSNNGTTQGNGATDSNINTGNENTTQSLEESLDESFEYVVGKTEVQTISTPGEVERITASVAIDGNISDEVKQDVQNIVENSIGMDGNRGDSISVVSMEFDPEGKAEIEKQLEALKNEEEEKVNMIKIAQIGGLVAVLLAIAYIVYRKVNSKKSEQILEELSTTKDIIKDTVKEEVVDDDIEFDNPYSKNIKKKRNYILGDSNEMTLEEEVKLYAAEKPDQVTEIIKTWLSE